VILRFKWVFPLVGLVGSCFVLRQSIIQSSLMLGLFFVNWSHFVKTSVLAICWIRCIDMLVRHHSVPCLAFLDVFIFT
jgi:hypothetical protein